MTDIIQSAYQMEVEWHMIQSTYQMEVEWQIWYCQHISWMYHICHSTSIWYVDCIISVIPLPSDMLTVLYLSFYFQQSTYQMEVEWQIWYSQHIRWKWNDWYGTLNISDGSGMRDIIQSTYQMKVEWQIWYTLCHSTSIWYVECIISVIPLPSDILNVSYMSFHFHHIRWKWNDRYGTLNISDGSGMTDMIQSTYQMEVEWQIWYSQHIR
jgi:hypothetical protein